ncbi:16S rRNA (cytosine(967)-C(5))-methyltransferase RsmB [Cohnella luojiensis]|uniref:16S rRNA (cytosine(967)-C(5))-methyltransferase n=1 Tax=Cohnella luojiensis TaxID=652876 RepID=A0A4Y8M8F2_9BACL|nr:16S rRNA (cytosine(967)-C(5))-methyltransferase RsmB [Cohnella luojiensis]TFE31844.1 16S rRNA (cytosine(967)-C(5))-methyltransferase RsmB [Cohnella luojiensis]
MKKTNRLPGGKPQGAREVAMNVLHNVETKGAYSGLELNQALQSSDLSRPDAALATELVYGTIKRMNTIDYDLKDRVKGWPGKVEPWVRSLLRMSYYQLRWLTRVPAHAAVDEAVRIAKKRGHAGIGGLVNGVLRGLLREGFEAAIPDGLPAAERISLAHSHPLWLVERWIAEYGEATTEQICAANNEHPHASARVNRLRASRDSVVAGMTDAGMEAIPSPVTQDGIIAMKAGNLVHSDWYKQGFISVQDESSMLVAAVADPKPGMQVLDCCAAPGGKTAHLAEIMRNEGKIIANDVHPHKEALIKQQTERLGLTSVETMVGDALELQERIEAESCDVVLLDAPCSGLGVIRRKPEIKWNKFADDITSLSHLQSRLLSKVQSLVKPGGVLVYSTCTIAAEENEDTISRFLAEHPEYSLDAKWPEEVLAPLRDAGKLPEGFSGMLQLLPHMFGSDGFFIARLRKQSQ